MDAAMTGSLFIFGLGYTAQRLARAYAGPVIATGRQGTLAFDDERGVRAALAQAQFVLSSVPPDAKGDPVLRRYGDALPSAPWLGYLSSTAVYGDAQGAWVDETSPTVPGERPQRTLADTAWQQLGAHVFRLPGIYGPGRSALDRVREGSAQLIDKPGHVFCRIHVDDIVAAVLAAMAKPTPGGTIFNVSDDEPASGPDPIRFACDLLGVAPPPLIPYKDAQLSPMARSFYAGCRRVKNSKMKAELGVHLRYPTYREGLRAIWQQEMST
jgi:nucleoside-diphosphate-sugar epimerase